MAYTPIADGDAATPDLFNTRFSALYSGNLDVFTAAGDMLYATAASTGARLAIGANNAVLTSTGSAPAWTAGLLDAHIAAAAEIAVSKLADGTARQLLQTDAAGTGVEWTSNIDIPGTLDVTGAAVFDATVTIGADTQLSRGAADRLDLASGDSFNIINGDLVVANNKKIRLDGSLTGDTYFSETTGNQINIVCGGNTSFAFQAAAATIIAGNKFHLDTFGDTYFIESSADVLNTFVGGTNAMRLDTSATAGHTRLMIYDVDNATLERVTVGAADSGGAGFKVLRIPN